MIKKIKHIGMAIQDIDAVLPVFKEAFGSREISRRELPEQKQISCLVQLGEDCLELMQPTSPEGVIGRFLRQKGEGLHHISLLCEDLKETTDKLKAMGMLLIGGDGPSGGKTVFVHPRSVHGVLLEISDQDTVKRIEEKP